MYGPMVEMDEIRIVYFKELSDISQIATLYYLSLNWLATPKVLEELRQNDDRYTPEFGIFAVTSDGTVIGGVLLMEIPTETLEGKLIVGGINAVATRPGYQRRGIMTTLLTRCHEYFAEHQLDYSFLTTSRSLGAHYLYHKLGYRDLVDREIAWKHAKEPRPNHDKGIAVTSFQKGNNLDVDKIFRGATEGSYGFVYRPTNFLKARCEGRLIPLEKMRLAKRNNETSGYAYWESSWHVSTCMEILALDKSSFVTLLADAENKLENELLVVHCGGLSKHEIDWLRSAHYHTGIQTYGTVMVRSLKGATKLRSLKPLFGVNKRLFRMGIWDST